MDDWKIGMIAYDTRNQMVVTLETPFDDVGMSWVVKPFDNFDGWYLLSFTEDLAKIN